VNKIREASSTTKVAEERDAREKELISLRQVGWDLASSFFLNVEIQDLSGQPAMLNLAVCERDN
jgi:hypothetical protein